MYDFYFETTQRHWTPPWSNGLLTYCFENPCHVSVTRDGKYWWRVCVSMHVYMYLLPENMHIPIYYKYIKIFCNSYFWRPKYFILNLLKITPFLFDVQRSDISLEQVVVPNCTRVRRVTMIFLCLWNSNGFFSFWRGHLCVKMIEYWILS